MNLHISYYWSRSIDYWGPPTITEGQNSYVLFGANALVVDNNLVKKKKFLYPDSMRWCFDPGDHLVVGRLISEVKHSYSSR